MLNHNCCRNPGSNQGPLDLQSNALPTELFRHINACFFSKGKLIKQWSSSLIFFIDEKGQELIIEHCFKFCCFHPRVHIGTIFVPFQYKRPIYLPSGKKLVTLVETHSSLYYQKNLMPHNRVDMITNVSHLRDYWSTKHVVVGFLYFSCRDQDSNLGYYGITNRPPQRRVLTTRRSRPF